MGYRCLVDQAGAVLTLMRATSQLNKRWYSALESASRESSACPLFSATVYLGWRRALFERGGLTGGAGRSRCFVQSTMSADADSETAITDASRFSKPEKAEKARAHVATHLTP